MVAFAQRQVTLTDFVFTFGGALLLVGAGLANALLFNLDLLRTRWLAWGLWLFVATGVIWMLVLIPIQIKQAKLAREFVATGTIPPEYWRLTRIWAIFGVLAIALLVVALGLMVYKPA